MDGIIAAVKGFAQNAHKGQIRKYTSDAYIVHPVRVMQTCRQYTQDVSVLSAALLHDVLEDTVVNAEELKQFLAGVAGKHIAEQTLQYVTELTDVYIKRDYPKWNRRKRKAMELERLKKTSPASQTIKYADIIDNCREIVNHDKDFAPVFLHECATLLKHLDQGNKELREIAQQTVDNELNKLVSA